MIIIRGGGKGKQSADFTPSPRKILLTEKQEKKLAFAG
jgi:hypothetical protein